MTLTVLAVVLLVGALIYWGAILYRSVRWLWHRCLKWRGGNWALRKDLKQTAKILGLQFCPEKVSISKKSPKEYPPAADHWAGACYTEKDGGRLLGIWINSREDWVLRRGKVGVLRHEMAHVFLQNIVSAAAHRLPEEQRRKINDTVHPQAELCARHLEELLNQLADFPQGASQ